MEAVVCGERGRGVVVGDGPLEVPVGLAHPPQIQLGHDRYGRVVDFAAEAGLLSAERLGAILRPENLTGPTARTSEVIAPCASPAFGRAPVHGITPARPGLPRPAPACRGWAAASRPVAVS
ncbi:hypothetical protein P9869_13305 [Streptomyces ossamyceticus]|nr:hypothetical protein [Streptomyces ossamyceticus]